MKKLRMNLLLLATMSVFAFTACDEDETVTPVNPIETGATVTVRNTFESAVFSTYPGFEIYVNESPFGDTATAVVSSVLEFDKYLGLYDIDLSNNSITYKLVDVAPQGFTFRTIEAGTFDRYYITFGKPQAFKKVSVNDEFVKATIVSSTELKVEIGEGYSFNSGHTFTITLE